MHRTVGLVLVYLNCHTYILFVVAFTLVDRLMCLVVICLFVCSWWLVFAGYYYCYWLLLLLLVIRDNHWWQCTKVEGAGSLPLGRLTGRDGQIFHTLYILYLRREDAILFLCMGIPIATIIAGEWLNSLLFHDDIKCITANGIDDYLCGGQLYMSHDNHSFRAKSSWEALSHS